MICHWHAGNYILTANPIQATFYHGTRQRLSRLRPVGAKLKMLNLTHALLALLSRITSLRHKGINAWQHGRAKRASDCKFHSPQHCNATCTAHAWRMHTVMYVQFRCRLLEGGTLITAMSQIHVHARYMHGTYIRATWHARLHMHENRIPRLHA